MIRLRFAICVSAVALVSTINPTTASARNIYVSPAGNDAWSGSSKSPSAPDGPCATLTGARDRIRQLRKSQPLTEPTRVLVEQGTWFLAQPFTLSAEDSGTTAAPISYEAAPGAHPVFVGGVPITSLTETTGIWTADTRNSPAGRFEQLYVNGQRATRERSPNTGFAFSKPATVAQATHLTSNTAELNRRILTLDSTHTGELASLTKSELTSTVLVAYHSWETSRHYMEAFDSTGTAVVTGAAQWPFHRWGPNQRYHLENFRAALDAPGEWFLDSTGKLLYIPRPGEKIEEAEVIAPVTEQFIRIAGDPVHDHFVTHVNFSGLAFRYSAYHLPPAGHSDPQAEVTLPSVIEVDGAQNVSFRNCEFSHLGTSAVWFRHGCSDCLLDHCYLDDLGAGGVRIGETVTAANPFGVTSHITVTDNIIRSCGRIYPGGIGVFIGRSSHNAVLHNDIFDIMYTGISVGWEWGYNKSDCDHNDIGFNHIHHLGWSVLSDMGGIYTLGVSPGTTLHDNVIHDVASYNKYGAGGWGIYNDEGSSGILSENNLVYNCKSSCYHQHYGEGNLLRNNILCYGGEGVVQLSKPEPHLSFSLDRNIFVASSSPLLCGKWTDSTVSFTRNLFWRAGADSLTSAALVYDKTNTAFDSNSLIADPQFVDPAHFDFHLRPASPASRIGFIPFAYEKAGVTGDAEWISRARKPVTPPTEFAQ